MSMNHDTLPPLPKPHELLAVHGIAIELFATMKRWFDVPDRVSLDLSSIDAATREMADPIMIAALALRKLQALSVIATPGVQTTTDIVINLIQDLDRALIQAPSTRLRLDAETADWDAELEAMSEHPSRRVPPSPLQDDPERDRFNELHVALHDAVRAVYDASAGEIRVFV
jgi:predicted N-formylglutamate amidohydrolase